MKATKEKEYFFMRANKLYRRVRFAQILYVESVGNYLRFHTLDQTWLAKGTIRDIDEALPQDQFFRVNRACIISMEHIDEFNLDTVIVAGNKIGVAEKSRQALEKRVTVLNHHCYESKLN